VQDRPDVAVLIGNDLFNAYLGRWLRRRGIRTVAFSPPQVWIWQSVLGPLAAGLTRVLASFPEEARAYEEAGVPTTFVGHHLADALHEVTPRERADARRALALTDAGTVVALMPGSRAHEVKRLAPALFGSARELANNRRAVQIVVAAADGFEATLRDGLARHGCDGVVTGDSYMALRAADAAVCCSGTATLEAALLGVPMTVVYRTSWTTYGAVQAALALGILPTGTMALPNLVVGRPIVRELKQAAVTPAAIAADTGALLDDPGRREAMRAALREVRSRIDGHGTMDRVASIVLSDRAQVIR
jgi:lipid-A-disaccharide synthase